MCPLFDYSINLNNVDLLIFLETLYSSPVFSFVFKFLNLLTLKTFFVSFMWYDSYILGAYRHTFCAFDLVAGARYGKRYGKILRCVLNRNFSIFSTSLALCETTDFNILTSSDRCFDKHRNCWLESRNCFGLEKCGNWKGKNQIWAYLRIKMIRSYKYVLKCIRKYEFVFIFRRFP